MAGKRTDKNHAEIRDGLRKLGFPVFDCSQFGNGLLDLIVGDKRGHIYLFDVKSPDNWKLTDAQKEFFTLFDGYTVEIIFSIEDALNILGW